MYWEYAYVLVDIEQISQVKSVQMITGLRYDVFHSIRNRRNHKNSLKNTDIIYAFLFLLIIVHGTCVLVWNNLSKQSTSIKLPNEDEKNFRYQKSKIPKERRVFILCSFLLLVFFLYLNQILNRSVDFPLTRV